MKLEDIAAGSENDFDTAILTVEDQMGTIRAEYEADKALDDVALGVNLAEESYQTLTAVEDMIYSVDPDEANDSTVFAVEAHAELAANTLGYHMNLAKEGTSSERVIIATEDLKEMVKKGWEAFLKMIKKIGEMITKAWKAIVKFFTGKEKEAKKDAENVKKAGVDMELDPNQTQEQFAEKVENVQKEAADKADVIKDIVNGRKITTIQNNDETLVQKINKLNPFMNALVNIGMAKPISVEDLLVNDYMYLNIRKYIDGDFRFSGGTIGLVANKIKEGNKFTYDEIVDGTTAPSFPVRESKKLDELTNKLGRIFNIVPYKFDSKTNISQYKVLAFNNNKLTIIDFKQKNQDAYITTEDTVITKTPSEFEKLSESQSTALEFMDESAKNLDRVHKGFLDSLNEIIEIVENTEPDYASALEMVEAGSSVKDAAKRFKIKMSVLKKIVNGTMAVPQNENKIDIETAQTFIEIAKTIIRFDTYCRQFDVRFIKETADTIDFLRKQFLPVLDK